jgi:uncharacterized C2H2 Zn-finger protein
MPIEYPSIPLQNPGASVDSGQIAGSLPPIPSFDVHDERDERVFDIPSAQSSRQVSHWRFGSSNQDLSASAGPPNPKRQKLDEVLDTRSCPTCGGEFANARARDDHMRMIHHNLIESSIEGSNDEVAANNSGPNGYPDNSRTNVLPSSSEQNDRLGLANFSASPSATTEGRDWGTLPKGAEIPNRHKHPTVASVESGTTPGSLDKNQNQKNKETYSTSHSDNDVDDKRRPQKHPSIYQCDLCPKRFTRNTTLVDHRRTHTNERPFQCPACDATFGRQKEMKRHLDTHSNEKKHFCQGTYVEGQKEVAFGCGKGFTRKDALKEHLKARVSEKCFSPRERME